METDEDVLFYYFPIGAESRQTVWGVGLEAGAAIKSGAKQIESRKNGGKTIHFCSVDNKEAGAGGLVM
jgi:hypothetical protein